MRYGITLYEPLMDVVLAHFKKLFSLGKASIEYQEAWRKVTIIRVFDRESKFSHVIAIKCSERKWPVPPSRADYMLEVTWRIAQRKVPQEIMNESEHTVFLVANFSSGVTGRSYLTKRISGKTTLVYYIQARWKAIREIIRKIMEIIGKFYSTRLRRIHEVKQQLEERGLDTRYLDINRIEAFLTILCMWVDRILQEV